LSWHCDRIVQKTVVTTVAFYLQRMDQCLVDGEAAQPVPGMFDGVWITRDVVGPFKGGLGSERW
jgi:hypothetical protein